MTTDLYRYVYDEAGQLKREDNVPYGITFTWQYDKGGNIVSRKYHTLTTEGVTPGAPMVTQPYTYSIGPWKDQLTSYNLLDITYDNAGNPINYMGKSLVWTMGRQLENYTSSGTTINYKYNDSGIRTQKTVGSISTDYALNGTQIIAQTTAGMRTDFRYDGNGKLIAIRYNGTEYYYATNILGDITGLIDSTGTIVVEYNYDAWGRNLFTTGTLATTLGQANPFRYRGYYFDTETGFYYLQSRYYDPNTGRFINADDSASIVQISNDLMHINIYSYCQNAPISFTDKDGHCPSLLDIIPKKAKLKQYYITSGSADPILNSKDLSIRNGIQYAKKEIDTIMSERVGSSSNKYETFWQNTWGYTYGQYYNNEVIKMQNHICNMQILGFTISIVIFYATSGISASTTVLGTLDYFFNTEPGFFETLEYYGGFNKYINNIKLASKRASAVNNSIFKYLIYNDGFFGLTGTFKVFINVRAKFIKRIDALLYLVDKKKFNDKETEGYVYYLYLIMNMNINYTVSLKNMKKIVNLVK